jgi:quinoprotein dehydrogenase-associated probable ABC transporter substrate-binding protein
MRLPSHKPPPAGTARWRRGLLLMAGLLTLFCLLTVLLASRAQAQTLAQAQVAGADAVPRTAFKVCQDPNNLPFANLKGEGIENRIAELFGQALGLPVAYYSVPQRFNFVRNTLRYKLPGEDYPCDILMAVPVGFDQVSATKPYYRSTYALVFAKGRGLDAVHSGEDFLRLEPALLARLRIGLYDRSPASAWLNKHHLVEQGVPYPIMSADPDQYPGQIIEKDLASGRLDAAIVWGPIAGYFARRVTAPALQVVPLQSEPGVRFDYPIAMGVRYGEPAWKQQIEGLIDAKRAEILAILQSYGVPLLDDAAQPSLRATP